MPFDIFEMADKDKNKVFEFSSDTRYNISVWKNNCIVMNIENYSPDNLLLLKISWHPYWRAYIDDKEISVIMNKFGLMEIDLALKKGNIRLEVRYNSFNTFTVTVSLISLFFALGLLGYFYSKELRREVAPVLNEYLDWFATKIVLIPVRYQPY